MILKTALNRCQVGIILGTAIALQSAHGDLIYNQVDGVGLVYDTNTGLDWTQDGNYSGDTFTWSGAETWAASLNIAGVTSWQIPTANEFASLYSQFEGTPHSELYGTVLFGPGPNDYVTNALVEYWTSDPTAGGNGTTFDTYAYPGTHTVDSLYNAWAVTTAVPEPGTLGLSSFALAAVGVLRRAATRKL